MRLILVFTLLLAALVFVSANPAYRKDPPIKQIDTDDSNAPRAPGPDQNAAHLNKHDSPPKQIDADDYNAPRAPGPDQNAAHLIKHEHDNIPRDEDDDMVVIKRRPYKNYQWPKSNNLVEIPYTTSGINNAVLQRAIEVFNAKTCIRFRPRASETNYVKFRSGSSCYALVGYQEDGEQTVDLTSSCAARKGKVMHEMMHVLSFLHEQCRPDRNSYITVHLNNIISSAQSNFDIVNESVDQHIPYDCDSILHYKGTAFASSSGVNTITSTYCDHLGNGDTRLSIKDYKRVNTLYSCGKPEYKYYKVKVTTKTASIWPTSSDFGTGTDCFIYLKLHGSAQTSTEFELDLSTDSTADLFESGSVDTFKYMAYRNDLGSITSITLRMVENGSAPGWKPSEVVVTDPATSTSVTFTNDAWIYPSSGEVSIAN